MRWAALALVSAGALLWVDALVGGNLVGGAPALLVVAACALLAGVDCPLRQVILVGLATATLLCVADHVHAAERFSFANDGVFYSVVVLGPALTGWLIGSGNRQVAELTARRRELEIRRDVIVRAAAAREREHVARRVDVILAGRLRGIVADAQALSRASDSGVAQGLETIESTARAALNELRDVLGVLRDDDTVAQIRAPLSWVAPDPTPSRIVDVLLILAIVPLAVETSVPGQRGWWWLNVIAAVAQGASLVLIRRRPLLGGLLLIVAALLQTMFLAPIPATVSWLLPGLLAAFLLAFLSSPRISVLGLGILIAGLGLITFVASLQPRVSVSFVPGVVMGLLAWGAGRVAASRQRRARELQAIADELDRTADRDADLAAAQQRAQLARELHDVGAHALTVVCLQAGAARAWWERDREHARPALHSVLAVAHGPLTQLSTSLAGLARDDTIEPLDADALEVLAGMSRALGLRVAVTVGGASHRIRDDVARVAYRIVQEALTNAAKHAGPTHVQIHLLLGDDLIEVRIVDSGPDVDNEHLILPIRGSGLGLRGMRERVDAMHGELFAGPLGNGFQVVARLPT